MTSAEQTARDLARFIAPNQVTELRALHVGGRGRTFAGWFDGEHLHDLARHALALARQAAGVYFVPNPISPKLAAKRLNRVLDVHRGFSLTHDSDVIERRYLIIDLDPHRYRLDPYTPDQDVPTTARELAFTRRIAHQHIIPFLAGLGFTAPIQMCSGNGVHLIYRMDSLPGGKAGGSDPAARILALLHERYSCSAFTVDPNTYNPCRMLKVPGTMVRRGEASITRPFRTARILEVPNDWQPPVSIDTSSIGIASEPNEAAPEPERRARQDRSGVARPASKPATVAATTTGQLFDPGRSGKASH